MNAGNIKNPNIIDEVAKEWWNEEMAKLRKYFFEKFVEEERPNLLTKDLKELKVYIPKNCGRVMQLCFFYDRIGFLCASEIIDADDILPPILHSMRKTWLAIKYVVDKYREPNDEYFDPIYMCAFEWLFDKSERYMANPSQLYVKIYGERFTTVYGQLDQNLRKLEDDFKKKLAQQEEITEN